jgi:hypothetical protein
MNQDYRNLTDDQLELVEKQTLRTLVQALQEYSREARQIFENALLRCTPRDAVRSTQNGRSRECVTARSAFRSRACMAFSGRERGDAATGRRRASPAGSW